MEEKMKCSKCGYEGTDFEPEKKFKGLDIAIIVVAVILCWPLAIAYAVYINMTRRDMKCPKCGEMVASPKVNKARSKKKFLIILGVVLILVGICLLATGEEKSHYTVGDRTVKSMAKASYEQWGTICVVSGGVVLLVGIIYKENNNTNVIMETPRTNINNEVKSSTSKLEELKNLLDKGIITQEEFDEKKKQLLEKI